MHITLSTHLEKQNYFYFTEQRHMDANTAALKQMWDLEPGGLIDDEFLEESLLSVHKCSISSRHNLIHFKTIHP